MEQARTAEAAKSALGHEAAKSALGQPNPANAILEKVEKVEQAAAAAFAKSEALEPTGGSENRPVGSLRGGEEEVTAAPGGRGGGWARAKDNLGIGDRKKLSHEERRQLRRDAAQGIEAPRVFQPSVQPATLFAAAGLQVKQPGSLLGDKKEATTSAADMYKSYAHDHQAQGPAKGDGLSDEEGKEEAVLEGKASQQRDS